MSHSKNNLRILRMSNGTQIIGRVLGYTDASISMDCVFNIVPLQASGTDYGLVPWITGTDAFAVMDVNILNVDVQVEPTEDFADGWNEACSTYQEVVEEEIDEKAKEAKGQITKDEIDQLFEEYQEEQRKKTFH